MEAKIRGFPRWLSKSKVLEFIANIVAQGDRYVNKCPAEAAEAGGLSTAFPAAGSRYPFWTDIVGILSVPWDHSLVADNFVDIFEDGWSRCVLVMRCHEHKRFRCDSCIFMYSYVFIIFGIN